MKIENKSHSELLNKGVSEFNIYFIKNLKPTVIYE